MMSVSSDSTFFGVGIHTERLTLQEHAVPHSKRLLGIANFAKNSRHAGEKSLISPRTIASGNGTPV